MCVYTALMQEYDRLHFQKFLGEVPLLCFTDSETLHSSQFQVQKVSRTLSDSVREARLYKVLAHQVLPPCDISIWMDASFEFQLERDIATWAVESLQGRAIAVLEHPTNDDVYCEAERCLQTKRDLPEVLIDQVARYRSEGFPPGSGMVATGIIVRDHRKPGSLQFCEAWWKEILQGSRRDQVSFNYVAWKTGIPFAHIEKLQAIDCFRTSFGQFHDHLTQEPQSRQ